MKKYKYALLSLTLMVGILAVFFVTYKMDKTQGVVTEVETENETVYACSPGPGVYYKLTGSSNYNIRSGPGTGYGIVGSASPGDILIVYCITGNWANLGGDRYINTANLNKLGVNVNVGNLDKNPGTFYRNKSYSGFLNVSVNNLPNEGASRLSITIEKNGANAEGEFNVSKSGYSNGNSSINFTRKNRNAYGTYQIVVRLDGNVKGTRNFTIEKDEFNFNVDKFATLENVAENEQGEWIFSLTDKTPSSLTLNDFSYSITKSSVDASQYFDVFIRDGSLVVRNKKMKIGFKNGRWVTLNKDEYAKKGTYKVTFTFNNQDEYSGANGFSKSQTFTINSKRTSIQEDSSAGSVARYQIDYVNEDYNVDIIGTTKEGSVTKYILDEHSLDGTSTTRAMYTAAELGQTYPNIQQDAIYVDSRASYIDSSSGITITPIVINFGNSVYITNYTKSATAPAVTYYVGTSTTAVTVPIATFQAEYPSAYEQLTSSAYNFTSTGSITQIETGIKTKIVKKIVTMPNKQPLAVTGGEVKIAAKFSGFTDDELEGFKADLTKINGNIRLVETEGNIVYDPNFSMELDTSNLASGYVYIVIKYTDNKEDYIGDYRVRFGFGNLNFNTSFTLEDGNVDYTVYSEVDPIDISGEQIEGTYPGANQKYEYNIGLYLKKARADYYKVNLDSINYMIFDKRVDKDSSGNYYFYDEIEYITKVKRIKDGKVYFDLSTDNGVTYIENQELTITEFASTYSEAYEYFKDYTTDATKIKYYNLDANGNIISDNYSMHPTRMYALTDDATDMTLDYVDASGVSHTVLMDTAFKRANPDIYSLISTRFGYDSNGNYILGAIRGRRKENIEKNNNLESHNVSNLFFVKKADRTSSVNAVVPRSEYETQKAEEEIAKKTLTILPKTEVPAGEYFIYVAHDKSEAIGFLYTDNSEDSAIELAIYPELYNRNIHMTSISYAEPIYDIKIDDPIETNTINDMLLAYANTESNLKFNMQLDYIYDTGNIKYKIEYKNDKGEWGDATDTFFTTSHLYPTVQITADNYETRGLTSSSMDLRTRPGITKKGDYRLVFEYTNNGVTMTPVIKEFTIKSNHYGLVVNPDEVVRLTNKGTTKFETFYSNQKYDIQIPIHLYTVDKPDNIKFELIYDTTGDTDPWIPENKEFRSYRNRDLVIFRYDYEVTQVDDEESIYLMTYSNYVGSDLPQAVEGKYILKISYQEEDGELAETSFAYTVVEPQREFKAVEEKDKAVSNNDEMYITREIESSYIVGSRLVGDEISYAIEMYKDGRYVDVSSENADTRYFKIEMNWKDTDVIDRVNYYGDMKINLATDKVDSIFELSDEEKFMLVITFGNVRYEIAMPDIRELFKWEIENVKITGVVENDGVSVPIEGFYNNAKPNIEINLKTPHEENAKFAITQECSGNVCTPSESMINYNDRFDIVSEESNKIVLKQKEDLAPELNLRIGKYQIVVYYTQTDYDIYDFVVRNEYLSIEFGDAVVETPVKGGISNDLFVNKDSVIKIPVSVIGSSYDNVTIDISNNNQSINYNHLFSIDREKFRNEHILEITYDSKSEIEAQDYLVMVHKTVDDEIIEDHEVFKFNATYFNYIITNVTYDPDPAVPNYENGGEIIFDIMTDELMTGDTFEDRETKRSFIENLTINNTEVVGNLNDYFDISYQDTSSITDFKLILRYSEDKQIYPGDYIITFNVSKNTYSLQKKQEFFVDSFARQITIDGVTINSKTPDELIHKNTGGTYLVNYRANYEIDTKNLYTSVKDVEGNDVTDKFAIDNTNDGQVQITFDPELHTIDYGIYTVTLTYADPVIHRDNVNTVEIIMYGDYKEITIKDMMPSVTPIIAENENQYYDFTLDISNLTEEEVSAMKIRIYDKCDNIVYSNVASEDVTNSFEVIKNEDADTYKVNILPYKARVGSYFVEFILPASFDPNNLGLQNISNKLEFTVDKTLYTVNLNNSSTISTQKRINNTDDIYDYIGVNGNYNFTSNSPIKDEYSIKVFNKLKLVKEIDVNSTTNNELENINFNVDEISNGEVEFALCIRGLPYASITKDVLEYIKVSELALVIDYHDVGEELTLDPGDVKTFELVIRPENATDKNLVFKSSDESVATFNGSTINVLSSGESTITVSNKEISKTFILKVSERLDSTTYEITQPENGSSGTIFVNSLRSKTFTKREFLNNLLHLSNGYKIYDGDNNDVTNSTDVIGTGYKINNGNARYVIIVIGDVNGSGTIDFGDATQTFRAYKGTYSLRGVYLKAAVVSKSGDRVNFGDATRLFRFYRGFINEL